MFCINCGSELEDGSAFCPNCGAPVEQEPELAGFTGSPAPSPMQIPSHQSPGAFAAEDAQHHMPQGTSGVPTDGGRSFEPSQPLPPQQDTRLPNQQAYAQPMQEFRQDALPQQNRSVPSEQSHVLQPAGSEKRVPAPKKKNAIIAGAVVVVVIVAAVAVGMFFANSFFNPESNGSTSLEESWQFEPSVEPRASVGQYSWSELSTISGELSAATSDDQVIQIAKVYGLVNADGRLDGSQIKDITLVDGTQAQAQIIGFAHDDKADGSGKAGITFILKDSMGEMPMNDAPSNAGGWEGSLARSWLASSGFAMLPEDLRTQIVEVSKMTNNVGSTTDVSSVTKTNDKLWLLSYVELTGPLNEDAYETVAAPREVEQYGDALKSIIPVYNAEGSQYKLYADTEVLPNNNSVILTKTSKGVSAMWWERSAFGLSDAKFQRVSDKGCPNVGIDANQPSAIAPGFCI